MRHATINYALKGVIPFPIPRPPVFVKHFHDTVIGYDHTIQAPSEEIGYMTHDFARPRVDIEPTTNVINEPVTLLGGIENFGHWCFEYLPRLAVLDRFNSLRRRPLAVWDTIPDRFLQPLRHLDLETVRVRPGRFRDVLIPSCPIGTLGGMVRVWADSIHWLRQRFPRMRGDRGGRRIYAMRRSERRQITNEEEVLAALEAHHYEVIDFSALPFVDQVRVASSARILVLPAGADTGLAMFVEDECGVVELCNEHLVGNFTAPLYAAINGNMVERLKPKSHGAFRGIDTDYEVDVPLMLDVIDRMERA